MFQSWTGWRQDCRIPYLGLLSLFDTKSMFCKKIQARKKQNREIYLSHIHYDMFTSEYIWLNLCFIYTHSKGTEFEFCILCIYSSSIVYYRFEKRKCVELWHCVCAISRTDNNFIHSMGHYLNANEIIPW